MMKGACKHKFWEMSVHEHEPIKVDLWCVRCGEVTYRLDRKSLDLKEIEPGVWEITIKYAVGPPVGDPKKARKAQEVKS